MLLGRDGTDGKGPPALRIGFLAYRSNPHSGGQGVYTRHLTAELVALGHEVTVFGGQPYPVLADGVGFVPVPSLDLYREPDPFRVPRLSEMRGPIDLAELAIMASGGFPEPLTFSLRARRLLRSWMGRLDIIHDNQCLGYGLLQMVSDGWPVLATVHHPITIDRRLEIAHAPTLKRRLAARRWYGFVPMQVRTARRLARVLTVSESSARDLVADMGISPASVRVVGLGVDQATFRPRPEVARVAGRVVTTASADTPLKGLVPLLEAVARLRAEMACELVVVGRLRRGSQVPGVVERLGLGDAITFVSGLTDEELAALYATAEAAVVPSLYEGFSLPAAEAMACGVALVASRAGALPEVVGADGDACLLVDPGDAGYLVTALKRLLGDATLRARLGHNGRRRAMQRFSWSQTARSTAEQYRCLLEPDRLAAGLPTGPAAGPTGTWFGHRHPWPGE
ncbi:MAG: glycosyltransferase family 4 protein [Acidimicrobiales bacterium]